MTALVRLIYIILMTGSGLLVMFATENPSTGIAILLSMTAIGLAVDCLHGDAKENKEMLKKIQEKLGIEEEKK